MWDGRQHWPINLAGLGLSWDNSLMTIKVDQKRRAVTPIKLGDVLEIEQQSPDVVVLKRTKKAASARSKLVRRNRRLVFVGEATTTDEVNRLLDDFP
jgi:bifunctional DNA-binding transcriptional regulator/antitoxin component of YhaV-PrlF toxin-antitoxin module